MQISSSLCACYSVSGTDIACLPLRSTPCPGLTPHMSGTHLAFAGTRPGLQGIQVTPTPLQIASHLDTRSLCHVRF